MEFGLRGPNLGALAREMERMNGRLAEELRDANRRIGIHVSGTAKRILQEKVYNVPIPLKASVERRTAPNATIRSKTTKGSKGKWTRTGNLKRMETYAFRSEDRGVFSVVLVNSANYSAARNELGRSGKRKIRSPGVLSVQWQEEAAKRDTAFIRATYEQAISKALERTVKL